MVESHKKESRFSWCVLRNKKEDTQQLHSSWVSSFYVCSRYLTANCPPIHNYTPPALQYLPDSAVQPSKAPKVPRPRPLKCGLGPITKTLSLLGLHILGRPLHRFSAGNDHSPPSHRTALAGGDEHDHSLRALGPISTPRTPTVPQEPPEC